MQKIELTGEQRLYLQRILDYLRINNRWPSHRYLAQAFQESDDDLDIEEVVQRLPPGLTSAVEFSSPFGRATVTVPAIYALQPKASELGAFVQVVKLCANTYTHAVAEARQVSSGTVLQAYPTWPQPTIYKLGLLLQEEMALWSSFKLTAERWSCKLSRYVRRLRDIETIEEYLEKREPPAKTTDIPSPANPSTTGSDITAQTVQIHPDIRTKCWSLYTSGDYDNAILNATKALEVAVRKQSRLPDQVVGADLMTQALNPNKPILEYSTVKAEQEGMMSLLRGIIQVYKNPQSHRFVGIQSKSECLGILLICSNLLSTIENLK